MKTYNAAQLALTR